MFKNFEGYPDPTAGRAIASITREERKAKAARETAAMAEAGAARKKRHHKTRRRKKDYRTKIGVIK